MSEEYPTDAELEAITAWTPGPKWSGSEPWLGILQECSDAWNHDMGHALWDDDKKQMTFVTGGWSGNESVLSALHENFSARAMLWLASFRGGKEIWGIKD